MLNKGDKYILLKSVELSLGIVIKTGAIECGMW